eukprot:7261825-Prymnesium_polylepis.1
MDDPVATTTTASVDACSICLETMLKPADTVALACGHFFHTNCIVEALRYSPRCPVCRDMPRGADEISEDDWMFVTDFATDRLLSSDLPLCVFNRLLKSFGVRVKARTRQEAAAWLSDQLHAETDDSDSDSDSDMMEESEEGEEEEEDDEEGEEGEEGEVEGEVESEEESEEESEAESEESKLESEEEEDEEDGGDHEAGESEDEAGEAMQDEDGKVGQMESNKE